MQNKLKNIISNFEIYGDYIIGVPFGTGHINDTYQVAFNQGGTIVHYTLQRINHNVFKNPVKLMENIERVTSHLANKDKDKIGGVSRKTLQVVKTHSGENLYKTEEGAYWRLQVVQDGYRNLPMLPST